MTRYHLMIKPTFLGKKINDLIFIITFIFIKNNLTTII